MDNKDEILVYIPYSFLIVVDDVGWWCGKDQRYKNGPSRSGLEQRRHSIEDYKAIIEIGKSLNMRIKCGFVIGEWDRTNVLARVRNSNKHGIRWDNASRLDSSIDETVDLINSSSDYMEIALHGLVHWYWDNDGKIIGPEFYQRNNDYTMTPAEIVREHLDAYFEIFHANRFAAKIKSFIPPCFNYIYSANTDQLSSILSEYGIKYVSTPFSCMGYTSKEKPSDVCVENGIITVDRTEDLTKWYDVGAQTPDVIKKSYYGMHWVNFLNNDIEKNDETVKEWIKYFAQYKQKFDILVAKDNAMGSTQSLYKKFTKINVSDDKIKLDFSKVDSSGVRELDRSMYINIKHPKKPIADNTIDIDIYEINKEFITYKLTRREPKVPITTLTLTINN